MSKCFGDLAHGGQKQALDLPELELEIVEDAQHESWELSTESLGKL